MPGGNSSVLILCLPCSYVHGNGNTKKETIENHTGKYKMTTAEPLYSKLPRDSLKSKMRDTLFLHVSSNIAAGTMGGVLIKGDILIIIRSIL